MKLNRTGSNWTELERNKINENWGIIEKSVVDAEDALINSEEALDKANEAIAKSDSTQTQLDTIVIEGDSSVEAAQARVDEKGVGHTTLKDRIDDGFTKVTSQLNETEDRQDSLRSANAVNPLNISNYLGNSQNTHPKVLYFENGWNGYKYWMGYTPYPYGQVEAENPCIAVSDDAENWTVPIGLNNPLEYAPNNGYNSDTHLVYREDLDRLEIWWRAVNTPNNSFIIYRKLTTDGVNWTDKELVIQGQMSNDILSPAIIFEDNVYKMWSCNRGQIEYRESNGNSYPLIFSDKQILNIDWGDLSAWHMDLIKSELGYEMIVTAFEPGGNNNTTDLYYLIQKTDGTFTKPKVIIERSKNTRAIDHMGIYRSSITKVNGEYLIHYATVENNVSKRRFISLSRGTNIFSLNGYNRVFDKSVSIQGGSVIENFDVTGITSIRILGNTPVEIKSFTGGTIGQRIDLIIQGTNASAIIKHDPGKLVMPGNKDYLVNKDEMGMFFVCNNNFTSEFRGIGASELANNRHHVQRISRDVSMEGRQRVDVPFRVKKISFKAILHNAKLHSTGEWASEGQPQVIYNNGYTENLLYESDIVVYLNDGTSIFYGIVKDIDDNGFFIDWTKSAGKNLTGTAQIIITASN